VPKLDLVGAITADNYKARNQCVVPNDIFNRFVLTAGSDRR
jgi:hypothetical protein